MRQVLFRIFCGLTGFDLCSVKDPSMVDRLVVFDRAWNEIVGLEELSRDLVHVDAWPVGANLP